MTVRVLSAFESAALDDRLRDGDAFEWALLDRRQPTVTVRVNVSSDELQALTPAEVSEFVQLCHQVLALPGAEISHDHALGYPTPPTYVALRQRGVPVPCVTGAAWPTRRSAPTRAHRGFSSFAEDRVAVFGYGVVVQPGPIFPGTTAT